MNLSRITSTTVLAVLGSLFLQGCGFFQSSSEGNQSPPAAVEAAEVLSDVDGILVATINPSLAQQIGASADSGIAGALIIFPAGALAGAADVTVEEGAAFDLEVMKTDLGVPSDLAMEAATGVLVIQASEDIDPLLPLQVSMPLAASAALLPETGMKPALLYNIVRHDLGGARAAGIRVDESIKIVGDMVEFSISYFGAYAIVYVPESFGETVEAATDRPIVTKQEEIQEEINEQEQEPKPDPDPGVAFGIVSSEPAANVSDIARPDLVSITFNDKLAANPPAAALKIMRAGDAVEGTWWVEGNMLLFQPKISFMLGETYQVEIGKALKSSSGVELVTSTSFTFAIRNGAWQVNAGYITDMPEEAQYLSVASLGSGKFGLIADKTVGGPELVAKRWAGDGWVDTTRSAVSDPIWGMVSVGSRGRFFAGYLQGLSGSARLPLADAFFSRLAAPRDLSSDGVEANYGDISAAAGPNGAVQFAYLDSATHEVEGRYFDGTSFSSHQVLQGIPNGGAGRSQLKLGSNTQGDLVMLYQVNFSVASTYLKVLKKPMGQATWDDLTPNNNEVVTVSGDIDFEHSNVFINDYGKTIAFWCLPGGQGCYARVHNGTTWDTAYEQLVPQGQDLDDVATASAKDRQRLVLMWLRGEPSNKQLEVVEFSADGWGGIHTLETTQNTNYSKIYLGMDHIERVHAVWGRDDGIYSARKEQTQWSSVTTRASGQNPLTTSFAIDPSGEAIFTWGDTSGVQSVSFR